MVKSRAGLSEDASSVIQARDAGSLAGTMVLEMQSDSSSSRASWTDQRLRS